MQSTMQNMITSAVLRYGPELLRAARAQISRSPATAGATLASVGMLCVGAALGSQSAGDGHSFRFELGTRRQPMLGRTGGVLGAVVGGVALGVAAALLWGPPSKTQTKRGEVSRNESDGPRPS